MAFLSETKMINIFKNNLRINKLYNLLSLLFIKNIFIMYI